MSRRKREHEEEHIDETWLIPYADLLTLLLALFIVLFASSTIDVKKYDAMRHALNQAINGGTGILEKEAPSIDLSTNGKEVSELELLKKQIDKYIEDKNIKNELKTTIKNDSLIITISDYALFDSGSAVIKAESRETISNISNMLIEYPNFDVLVSGHTDNVPINTKEFESNWDLSAERALNIMKLILKNKDLNPGNFSAIGYGEYRPVDSNDNDSGRAKNRRVELAIKKNQIPIN
ncbi:MAG: flagellar motor protein MotB [Bacillota bacterium]